MSKITFRADDDLVERVERLDASKSEVMREALRAYLDDRERGGGRREPPRDPPRGREQRPAAERTLDELFADRLDTLLAERFDALLADRLDDAGGQDIDLTVSLEGASDATRRSDAGREPSSDAPRERASDARDDRRSPSDGGGAADDGRACGQCGESLSDDHVYCPNCGEKASRRVFCDCGDELRTDWAFCPGCGRRTPAADVLDNP